MGQGLTHKGEHNVAILVGALRNKICYDATGELSGREAMAMGVILEALKKHPGMRESAAAAVSWAKPNIPKSIAAFFHYEFTNRDAAMCENFGAVLAGNKLLASSDVVMQLRKQLDRFVRSDAPYPRRKAFGLIITAWNYWRRDEQCGKLTFRATGPNAQMAPEII